MQSTIVVEAQNLTSEERAEERAEVRRPKAHSEQREQLRSIVERLHPTARIRSYDAGVASFLAPGCLIVARYESSEGMGTAAAAVGPPELFAR